MTASRPRHVSPLLATAIIAVPVVFVWVLLLPGFARSTRQAGLTFAGANVLAGVVVAVFG